MIIFTSLLFMFNNFIRYGTLVLLVLWMHWFFYVLLSNIRVYFGRLLAFCRSSWFHQSLYLRFDRGSLWNLALSKLSILLRCDSPILIEWCKYFTTYLHSDSLTHGSCWCSSSEQAVVDLGNSSEFTEILNTGEFSPLHRPGVIINAKYLGPNSLKFAILKCVYSKNYKC